jgi:hypothetical protein
MFADEGGPPDRDHRMVERQAILTSVTFQGNVCSRARSAEVDLHVYRDGELVVKWDLDNRKPMKGSAPQRVLELIRELEAEGLL